VKFLEIAWCRELSVNFHRYVDSFNLWHQLNAALKACITCICVLLDVFCSCYLAELPDNGT